MAEICVRTDRATQPRLAGVGFHVSFHQHGATPEHAKLLWERWRELRPSFARVGYLFRHGQAGLEPWATSCWAWRRPARRSTWSPGTRRMSSPARTWTPTRGGSWIRSST